MRSTGGVRRRYATGPVRMNTSYRPRKRSSLTTTPLRIGWKEEDFRFAIRLHSTKDVLSRQGSPVISPLPTYTLRARLGAFLVRWSSVVGFHLEVSFFVWGKSNWACFPYKLGALFCT